MGISHPRVSAIYKCWKTCSPNLNPIENVWALFKTNYRKAVWKRQKIPRNENELIELAQEVAMGEDL